MKNYDLVRTAWQLWFKLSKCVKKLSFAWMKECHYILRLGFSTKPQMPAASVALYAMQPIPMPLERCAAPDAFVLRPVPSSSLVLAKIGGSKWQPEKCKNVKKKNWRLGQQELRYALSWCNKAWRNLELRRRKPIKLRCNCFLVCRRRYLSNKIRLQGDIQAYQSGDYRLARIGVLNKWCCTLESSPRNKLTTCNFNAYV